MAGDPLIPEAFCDVDMFPRPPVTGTIEIGTVGWEGEDTWFEKGTEDNDGLLLVRVQLYRGREWRKPEKPKEGIAEGHRRLCVMSSIFGHRILPKGTRVYVAFPAGFEEVPAAGVIFATVEKNPMKQFDDDRLAIWFGDDTH